MSIDFVLLNAEGVPPGVSEPPEGWSATPMGEAEAVRKAISSAMPGVDWADPKWGVFVADGVHFGIGLPAEGAIQSVGLTAHGSGDLALYVRRLCAVNNWVAFDDASEGFIQNRDISF